MTSREFSVEIIEKDYIAINLHMLDRGGALKSTKVTCTVLGILFVIGGLSFAFFDLNLFPFVGVPVIVVGLFYGLVLPTFCRTGIKRNVLKMLSKGRTDSILGEFTYRLSHDAFEVNSDTGFQGIYWPAIDHIAVTDDYLFILNSAISGFMIPKRELTETAFEECVNLVEKYAAEAKSLKPDDEASTD